MKTQSKSDETSIEEYPSIIDATTPEKLPEDTSELFDDKKLKLPAQIVEYVKNEICLFTDGKETAYAQFNVSDHDEIRKINSKRFSRWLLKIAITLNNEDIPSKEVISTATYYLEALAYDGPEFELYNRVGKSKEEYWYDLSDAKWQAIKISKNGWEIVSKPPILFKRYVHQDSQLYPSDDGDVWKLCNFFRVTGEKKILLLVYIISCFIPDIPHPVLIIYGSPGSGKSMTMEHIRKIIDPSKTPRLKFPKNDKDAVQIFDHHYVGLFDNLQTLNTEASDTICRVVTGEGSEYRALYTDDDSIIRNYKRCIMLNGINIPPTRDDLLDRSILIHLKKFNEDELVDETKLREDFINVLPSILGGILDTLVKAMQIYPNIELNNLPRMADFVKWGYAIAEALGGYGDQFIESYLNDQKERINETVESNPFPSLIIALISKYKEWDGTPTELYETIKDFVYDENLEDIVPKSPGWVTKKLNEFETVLRHKGIDYDYSRKGGGRKISLKLNNSVITDIPSQLSDDKPINGNEDNNIANNMTVKNSYDDSNSTNNVLELPTDSNDNNDSINQQDNQRVEKILNQYITKTTSNELDMQILQSIHQLGEESNYKSVTNHISSKNPDYHTYNIKYRMQELTLKNIIIPQPSTHDQQYLGINWNLLEERVE